MSGGKQTRGYTIVEVMIVLAVSSFMFVIAANFINGKQANSAFTAGVNDFASKIQLVQSSVYAGHYTDVPIKCTASAASLTITGLGALGQGTNKDCVFLGKVVHLSSDNDPTHYEIFSVIGRRVDATTGGPVTTLAAATPIAAYNPPAGVDFTTHSVIAQQLSIKKVSLVDGSGVALAPNSVYDFGFIQSVGGGSSSGSYASAGENLLLVYVPLMTNTTDTATSAGYIKSAGLKSARSVTICLTDGSRLATVSIGTDTYSQLTVSRKLRVATC